MRRLQRWLAVAFGGGLLVCGSAAVAQDRSAVKYWPQLEIGFPVPQAVLDLKPKPVKLRLYSAPPNGNFTKIGERATNDLQPIPNRLPGFQYTARGDGEEEFAVQLVFDDGTVSPTTEKLRADSRVIFDTRPPVVNVAASGQYGVEWNVQEENLETNGVRLECRWVNGDVNWFPVAKTRGNWTVRDSYTWAGLARDNRTLEARVAAKDKAGHETFSRIVRLPATGGTGGLQLDDLNPRPRSGDNGSLSATPRLGSGGSTNDDFPGQPQIVYVNNTNLTVKSKLNTVTRSGVKVVHLWAKNMTANPNAEWKLVKSQTCDISYEQANPSIEIPYAVTDDGRYGFIVIPESGAGKKDNDPRPNSLAQHLVEVDTKKPVVKVVNVTPTPGGATGTKVEIEWNADDRNLMPDPIVLEYADTKTAEKWTAISEQRLPNSRRYIWEVPEKTPYKFYVRVRATDKATNTGDDIYAKEVIIDLDKPSATIEYVKPAGGSAPITSDRLPSKLPDSSKPADTGTPGVTAPSLIPIAK